LKKGFDWCIFGIGLTVLQAGSRNFREFIEITLRRLSTAAILLNIRAFRGMIASEVIE